MELLNGKIRSLYFRYLSAAFGSALISSIYGVVDMAMVGQYQGPDGTAALAVVAPVWNVIYSLGLLMGTGGSVLFSMRRGSGKSGGSENQYFTAALIGSVILAAAAWACIYLFEAPILIFFGADETLLPLAAAYLKPIKVVFPLFLFGQMLAAFLRNDGDPALATAAVLSGGIFNVFGDYFFVFPCDMGMYGAGLATAIGCAISVAIMLTHFVRKRNTLRLMRTEKLARRLFEISVTGFSTFFIDVAMGILTVLFNRQIMKYLGSNSLSVYGCVINVSTFVQCCAYSIGQAAQPIISTNYGAQNSGRIRETLRLAVITSAVFGIFWTVLSELFPNLYIRIFMDATPEIFAVAPEIIRLYSVSFLLLPINIFSTYYFQAIMQPRVSFAVSVMRGLVISGALILFLPAVLPANCVWFAMPITELVTAVYVVLSMKKYTGRLPSASV